MAANVAKLLATKGDGGSLTKTPSLQRPEENQCTTCRAQHQPHKPLLLCGQCRGALYCSEQCAQDNAARHRKLCYKYKVAKHPEGEQKVRAVYFPVGKPKPEIAFVDSNNWEIDAEALVCPATEPADSPVIIITVTSDPLTSQRLPFDMKIIFTASTAPLNTALLFCFSDNWELPAPRFPWAGAICVMRVAKHTNVPEDITMADFKAVLDFFAWCACQFTPEMMGYIHNYDMAAAATTIRGALIRCEATETLNPGEGAIVPLEVDHLHPIRGLYTANNHKVGDLSFISTQLGIPLRVYGLPNPPLETDKGRWEFLPGNTTNIWAARLMAHLEHGSHPFSSGHSQFTLPECIGDVIVVREDGNDLTVDEVVAVCLEARGRVGKNQTPNNLFASSSYKQTLEKQQARPVQLSNLNPDSAVAINSNWHQTTRSAPADIPIDPILLATVEDLVAFDLAAQQVTVPIVHGPIDAYTIPSLWCKVKTRQGCDNLTGTTIFEGYSFQKAGRHDPLPTTGNQSDGKGSPDAKDGQKEGLNEELARTYPSPPPWRYNYSADVISKEEHPIWES